MVHALQTLAQIASDWFWEMGPDLRYTAFAGRFEEFTGRPPADSIGRSRAEIAANAQDPAFWVPHLDDLACHRPFRDFVYPYPHPDGRTRWFKVSGQPLFGADGVFQGYRGVGTDVTAERDARAALDATLEAMAQGICMFDREQRLVVCNERYAALFGLTRALTRPGTPLREILEHRVAVGQYAGLDPEAFIAERLRVARENRPAEQDLHMQDGRVLALVHRPLADGGYVTTFEDITPRIAAEAELAEQNRRLDAALSHMSHGLFMLDAEQRITVLNRQFLDLYGLSPEVVRPGTSAEELIRHSAELGNFPGLGPDEAWAKASRRLASRADVRLEQTLPNGRTIALAYTPVPGGGWVTVHEDITDRKKAEARVLHMARHDALTDLPNRVLFHERLAEALGASDRAPVAVLCLDLDRFKAVNDTLGHAVGDELLRQVTVRLRAAAPGEGAVVARLGGDEFSLLLPACTPEQASACAKRLIEGVAQGYDLGGQRVNVGVSIGIALSPLDGRDPHQMLRCADMALYRAKADGRGVFRFFEPEMDARMQTRRQLELDLRDALAAEQFELHYQPLLALDSGRISGLEALVRWRHPTRGLVSPADFIPLAEEIGLIVPLGEWIIRQACREAVSWPQAVRVAVNLSPVQFRNPSLVLTIVSALAASGLDPRRLELEITESLLLQETEATLATLHQLRALGVRIALDDFGTGYSSLSYLRAFPFDKIKIDRSFIADLTVRADSIAIVRAVTSLGASLGMTTTAEGIETREQLDRLRDEGCTEVQGFLFSPPKPAGEVARMLMKDLGAEIRAA